MQILDCRLIIPHQVLLVPQQAPMDYQCTTRHLNSQHYRNLLIDQTEEQRLHQKVVLLPGLLAMLKSPIIWAVMEAFPVDILSHPDHLSGEFPREVRIVVHLRPEEVWDHHQQAVGLVRMDARIHETLLVQEVGKGRRQALYILDRRGQNLTT